MRIYIYKSGTFKIVKETTIQSILCDLFTCGFFCCTVACGIAFELFVGRSWLIEFTIVFMALIWIFGYAWNKKKEITKEELIKMIEDL